MEHQPDTIFHARLTEIIRSATMCSWRPSTGLLSPRHHSQRGDARFRSQGTAAGGFSNPRLWNPRSSNSRADGSRPRRCPGIKSELLVEQIKPLETGSVGQRQRAVILFGVVCDSAQARSSLKRLEEAANEYGIPFSDEQLRINSILEGLFESVVPGEDQFGELSADEETFLREQLGWFGELAIARTQGDDKSQWSEVLNSSMLKLVIVIAFMSIGGLLALLGIAGLICAREFLQRASPPASNPAWWWGLRRDLRLLAGSLSCL